MPLFALIVFTSLLFENYDLGATTVVNHSCGYFCRPDNSPIGARAFAVAVSGRAAAAPAARDRCRAVAVIGLDRDRSRFPGPLLYGQFAATTFTIVPWGLRIRSTFDAAHNTSPSAHRTPLPLGGKGPATSGAPLFGGFCARIARDSGPSTKLRQSPRRTCRKLAPTPFILPAR